MEQRDRKGGEVLRFVDVQKADTKALITNGTDAFPEDTYIGSYWTGGTGSGVAILEPQYKPGTLYALLSQNNCLSQCVEAMEVNIDGTGHSIELASEEAEEVEKEKVRLTNFFDEPYPGKTMPQIRRAIRRDLEGTGNGYMEVISSAAGELVMLNALDCNEMRLIRMDDPVIVTKTVVRDGVEVTLTMRVRERRFVQQINGKKVYFKEFGASRDLNRDTGEWAPAGSLPVDKRASEVIHFIANKEPKTPYGTPRWINQLPSVLGSRKAEEHNLSFFDSGGLPPVLVIVEGGTLGDTVKTELRAHLSGTGGNHRAAVVEAVSTSGSLDSAGSVRVRVERFGSERQQDAMFQAYDKNSKDHIRTAFRLPPLFIGEASDYNFATAYTAYMVAEAQVFYPDRDEFDNIINTNICRRLGVRNYRFRSLPMTLVDVEKQLKALEMASTGGYAKAEGVLKSLNEITGLSLEYTEPPKNPAPMAEPGATLQTTMGTGLTKGQEVATRPSSPASKGELSALANKLAILSKIRKGEVSPEEAFGVYKSISAMNEEELSMLGDLMTADLAQSEGLVELCSCAAHVTEE